MKFKLISHYGVTLLMLTVIAYHFINTNKGLTRWKGGGFGMYSEQHVSNYRLDIKLDNGKILDFERWKYQNNYPLAIQTANKFLIYPEKYKKNIKRLIEKSIKKNIDSFIIYIPFIDKNNTYSYKEYVKGKF